MSQKRFHEWKTVLSSDDENKAHLGQYFPGRYCGFDRIGYGGSGSNFTLFHGYGVTPTKANGTLQSLTGVYCTPAGVVISEDASIAFTGLTTNVGNATDRIDLLVANHAYGVVTPGGAAATYTIIPGSFGAYVAPTLPNPLTQTILGEIHLKAGVTQVQALIDISAQIGIDYPHAIGVTNGFYVPAKASGIGGRDELVLSTINKLSGRLDTANHAIARYRTVNTNHSSLELPESSNTIYHPDLGGSGVVIDFMGKPYNSVSGSRLIFKVDDLASDEIYLNIGYAGAVPSGYCKIKSPYTMYRSFTIGGYGTFVGIYIGPGDIVVLDYINNVWQVTSLQSFNSGSVKLQQKVFGAFRWYSGTIAAATGDQAVALISDYNPQSLSLVSGEIVIPKTATYKLTVSNTLIGNPPHAYTGFRFWLSSSTIGGLGPAGSQYVNKGLPIATDSIVNHEHVYILGLTAGDKITNGYTISSGGAFNVTLKSQFIIEELV